MGRGRDHGENKKLPKEVWRDVVNRSTEKALFLCKDIAPSMHNIAIFKVYKFLFGGFYELLAVTANITHTHTREEWVPSCLSEGFGTSKS